MFSFQFMNRFNKKKKILLNIHMIKIIHGVK